jgi:hypothetical protein
MEIMKRRRKEYGRLDGKNVLQKATKITFSMFVPEEMKEDSNLNYKYEVNSSV